MFAEPSNRGELRAEPVPAPFGKRCIVWVRGVQCEGWREPGSHYCWFHKPRTGTHELRGAA